MLAALHCRSALSICEATLDPGHPHIALCPFQCGAYGLALPYLVGPEGFEPSTNGL